MAVKYIRGAFADSWMIDKNNYATLDDLEEANY